MNADYHWTAILVRSLSGLFLGALTGAFSGGLIGLSLGAAMEAVQPSMAGMASACVMASCAIVAIPGSVIAGACGAVWRSRLIGAISGMAGSLFAISYPIYLLCRYDDRSSPYSIILIGVSPILGSLLAGAFVGHLAAQHIHDW